MKGEEIDFLLLNCCNLPWRPIYPYAFVQISEIAKRNDIRVKRIDLLYVENWYEYLRRVITTQRPKMVGIHLRQGDSLDLSNYDAVEAEPGKFFRTYFPIEDSKRLIQLVRRLTDVPIIMGGFGFTTHARKLAQYLEIDLGLQGCPDGFFNAFNDTLSGRNLKQVPGLIHKNGNDYIYNDVGFYKPAENTEYHDEIISEIKNFYGSALHSKTPPTIAIEVSRGCPFQCYFCVEPDVKGKRIDKRNIDVVEAELEFLLKNDLYDFWFICSELNIGGAGFALELAERVIRLNEKYPRRKIKWSGYSLPSLGHDELKAMMRAGYTGAMNDILSLDDENLRKATVPYKKDQAVSFLKNLSSIRKELLEEEKDNANEVKYTASTPLEYVNLISFFWGNAHANEKTIARTLAALEANGLTNQYSGGYVIPSTRVFAIGRTQQFVDTDTTYSFGPQGVIATDTKSPTFHFPGFLVNALGTRDEIYKFFDYVSGTLMSKAHRKSKYFSTFLAANMDNYISEHSLHWQVIYQLLECDSSAVPCAKTVQIFLDKLDVEARQKKESIIHQWLMKLFAEHEDTVRPVIELLGAEHFINAELKASEYVLTFAFYRIFSAKDEWLETAGQLDLKRDGYAVFYMSYLTFLINLQFRDDYKGLLFDF
jgi:hypothetical protein